MGLFSRAPAPPAWAQPLFDRKGWEAFRAELARTVTQLDPEAVLDDENARVELVVDRMSLRTNMQDLAVQCAGNDPAEVLAAWAEDIVEAGASTRPPETFEEAAPLLRVQVYSEATRPPNAAELAPSFWLAAVVDLPAAMIPVIPELLRSWKTQSSAMLDRALHNMYDLDAPSFDDKFSPLRVAHGDEYLAATTFAQRDRLVGDAPHGALVTFPCRSSTLFLPLHAMPSDVVLRRMALATDKLFETASDPISRELYWCTPEDLSLVRVSRVQEHGALMFMWPPGLDALLQRAVKS
jgi:hypothetical protein